MKVREFIRGLLGWWLVLLLMAVGVVYGLIYADRPSAHDDLNYLIHNAQWLATHHPAWLRWPTHVAGMWLEVNGRLGDSLNFLWLNVLPRWATGALEGLFMVGLYGGVIAFLRRNGYGLFASILAAALMMFGLPWWDGYGLYVVHINYLWGCTLALWALYFFIYSLPRSTVGRLALGVLCFVAAAWHEAIGVPVALAVSIAFFAASRRPGCGFPTLMFILGGLFTLTSPGIWHRFGADSTPDDNAVMLVIKTVPLVALLAIILIIMAIGNTRELWRKLTAGSCATGILSAAALASGAIAVASGMIGRSGWFAQVFALLALAALAGPGLAQRIEHHRIIGCAVSIVLLTLMTIQTHLFFEYQRRFDAESHAVIEQYATGADGVVISDIYCGDPAPAFLLGRAHRLPPIYDPWVQSRFEFWRETLGLNPAPLVVIPTELAALEYASPARAVYVRGAVLLPVSTQAVEIPAGTHPYPVTFRGTPALLFIPIPPGDRPIP